jgi:hypothetical protein
VQAKLAGEEDLWERLMEIKHLRKWESKKKLFLRYPLDVQGNNNSFEKLKVIRKKFHYLIIQM